LDSRVDQYIDDFLWFHMLTPGTMVFSVTAKNADRRIYSGAMTYRLSRQADVVTEIRGRWIVSLEGRNDASVAFFVG
jgi:hypothetical protein